MNNIKKPANLNQPNEFMLFIFHHDKLPYENIAFVMQGGIKSHVNVYNTKMY